MSDNNGWNSRQMEILGLPFPPEKGWRERVLGRVISTDVEREFLEAKGRTFRKPRFRKLIPGPKKTLKKEARNHDAPFGWMVVYTDGGYSHSLNKGAWAYCISASGKVLEKSMAYTKTTSNRMEVMAAIAAIKALPEGASAYIHADSQYLVHGIEHGWAVKWRARGWNKGDPKKGGKRDNWDLWKLLLEVLEGRQIRFKWVKAHSGNDLNERCDKLVGEAIKTGPYISDAMYQHIKKENEGKW